MGKLIVVEGACDGIGKSTQYTLLKERLIKDGNNVVSHHFPSYGEYQGVPVEKYLKGKGIASIISIKSMPFCFIPEFDPQFHCPEQIVRPAHLRSFRSEASE